MRKKLLFLTFAGLTTLGAQSQLVNDGAVITIQPGAVVFCAGNVENKNSGTITNNGKLEIQGNFQNAATYNNTVGNDDSLIFSGAGNATVNGGVSTFNFVQINKAANTDEVKLINNFTVTSKLIYNSGTFTTDPIANSWTLNAAQNVPFEFTPGREIVGRVRRTAWTNAAATVFNQPNMVVTTNGGTNPSEFTVNMIPEVNGGDPTQNEREVKRKFVFSQVGGTGYTADAKFPYNNSELNTNTEGYLVPWNLPVAEWTGRLTPVTRDAANDWVSTTAIPESDVAQEWKLADPRYGLSVTAYIKGAWNNPTGLMRTLLNSSTLLPLNQPFSAAPHNYGGSEAVGVIPNANVVDWILVEFRKPASGLPSDASPSTSIGKKAGFLLNNGTIVDLDGITPISLEMTKQGAGFIVLKTRNHLAVMSNSLPSNEAGTYSNNFSVFANSYKNPLATSDPVVILSSSAPGNTIYGMWPGDVNRSGSVTTADITPINIAIAGPASGNTNVYNVRDTNLDRNVTTADVSITNTSISAFAQGSAARQVNNSQQENKVLKSHVPGESN